MSSIERAGAARTAIALGAAAALAVPALLANSASADSHESYFDRVATFPVFTNNADPGDEIVAEIVDYWSNGQELVYTDGEGEQLGFVDITTPAAPAALPVDNVALGGEPTSVAVVENASASRKSD